MKAKIFFLICITLLQYLHPYSFIPKAGPSTNYGTLEIVPENDSIITSNTNVSYYLLTCDRYKMNINTNTVASVVKGAISEKLYYPNLRRSYSIDFPGSDARYDYQCWSSTYNKSGTTSSTSIKKTLRVGDVPSEVSNLDFAYSSQNFEITYDLPDNNGAVITSLDVYLRSKSGKYYRLCHFTKTIYSSCTVSGFLLLDNPFNMTNEDLISVYVVSTNDFGTSKLTYSTTTMYVKTLPKDPLLAPTKNELTSSNQIVITITAVDNASSYDVYYSTDNVTWYVLSTGFSDTTYTYTSYDIQIGDTYYFKYKTVNDFGESSNYSPVSSITISSVPERMSPPEVTYSIENSGSISVRLLNGSDNGSTILGYTLQFKSVYGELLDMPWCDNSETECSYPIYTFKDSPYYLETGDMVYAASSNYNANGSSEMSSLSEGLVLKASPSAPSIAPYSGNNTNKFQASIKITELTEEETGYELILSYNTVIILSDTNYINLAGADNQTPFTDTSIELLYYDVEPGQTYKFAYRAKNAFGWGPYSEIGYITIPSS